MIKESRHWLDCEIPASLERVLGSEEPVELDELAIERMSSRLQKSLGASFDARPAELAVSWPVWRAVLTGLGALAAVGVTWWLASSHAALESATDADPLGASSTQEVKAAPFATNDPRTLQAAAPAPTIQRCEANDPRTERTEPLQAATVARGAVHGPPTQRTELMHGVTAGTLQRSRRAELTHGALPGLPKQRVAAKPGEPTNAAEQGRRAERARVPAADSGTTAEPPSEPLAAPGLAEELQGLAQIRNLLAQSPERALAVADEQLLRFARGVLGPERELLRLDALVRLGRRAQAQVRAAQLQAAPENHPYRARIAELLER